MTGKSLPVVSDSDPTDVQIEKLADAADEGLASMTSKVLADTALDPMTPGLRVMGLFKFLVQYVVRTLRVHAQDDELRSSLIEIIDEELSAPRGS